MINRLFVVEKVRPTKLTDSTEIEYVYLLNRLFINYKLINICVY